MARKRRRSTHSVVRRHNKDGSVTTTHRYGSTDIWGTRHVDYYTTKQSAQQYNAQLRRNQENASKLLSVFGWIVIVIAVILGSLAIKIKLYFIEAMILGIGLVVFCVKLSVAFPNATSNSSSNGPPTSTNRSSSPRTTVGETECPYCGSIVAYVDVASYKKCDNCGMTVNIRK